MKRFLTVKGNVTGRLSSKKRRFKLSIPLRLQFMQRDNVKVPLHF